MQGVGKGDEVLGSAEEWVEFPYVLGPVAVVRITVFVLGSFLVSADPSRGKEKGKTHPSREFPMTFLTNGEIHTAVAPRPWM